jgi:hypothetical protein
VLLDESLAMNSDDSSGGPRGAVSNLVI